MDHTEGFDILDGEDQMSRLLGNLTGSKKGSKRSKASSYTQMNTSGGLHGQGVGCGTMGAVRQRHAFQLETLAEFAEYHLLKTPPSPPSNDNSNH